MHTLVKTAVTTKKTCKKLSYYKVQAAFNGLASRFAELFHIPMTLVLRSRNTAQFALTGLAVGDGVCPWG